MVTPLREVRGVRSRTAADVEQAAACRQHPLQDAPRPQAHQRTDARFPQPRVFVAQLVPDPDALIELHQPPARS